MKKKQRALYSPKKKVFEEEKNYYKGSANYQDSY